MQNTERSDNLLIGALKQFPLEYTFNAVFRGPQVGFAELPHTEHASCVAIPSDPDALCWHACRTKRRS